jgi:zinc D-Ala-D-Ala carboxypeptidase
MSDRQLSKNFWLSEFVRSQTASRHRIDNTPPASAVESLKTLVEQILQPIRDEYKQPLIITSGYRCRMLNKIIGGASRSQHQFGEAADFSVTSMPHLHVVRWIERNLEFDQLILEYYKGGSTGWIHVSFSRSHNRKQVFSID